jgi:hypothetical protein
MMKSITRTMLTSAMGIAWKLISTGEHVVAYSESWEVTEANAASAGFVERAVWRAGTTILRIGEWLELAVNRAAMGMGYNDGEVSGMMR